MLKPSLARRQSSPCSVVGALVRGSTGSARHRAIRAPASRASWLQVRHPARQPPNPSGVPESAGVWVATGSMGTPRSGHTAVRLLDGRVLVVGGADGDENDTSAELYDPATGTWSATGNMVKPPGGFPATLLLDGRVLVGMSRAQRCTTRQAGPGPPPGRWSSSTLTGRHWAGPRCCATAGCSWSTTATAPSCTTPTAGPGPPRGS